MLWLLSCARPVAVDPAACGTADLPACRMAASLHPDEPVSWQLDRWACDQGHAASCLAVGRPEDVSRACHAGLDAACVAAAALPDEPAARGLIGEAAERACAAEDEAACARLRAMGWRSKEVADVRMVTTGEVVLPGGTALSRGFAIDRGEGLVSLPLPAGSPDVQGLHVTADGRVLARTAGAVWSVLDGSAVSARAWPAPEGAPVFSPDGSVMAQALEGDLVAVWDLRDPRVRRVVETGSVDDVSADGQRLLAGGRVISVASGKLLEEHDCASPSRFTADGTVACPGKGIVGVEPGRDAFDFSPDGALAAVARPAGTVHLFAADGSREVAPPVALPPLGESPALSWSPDGGRLLVSGKGFAAVISRPSARGERATDDAIVAGLRPPPRMPEGAVLTLDDQTVAGKVRLDGRPVMGATVAISPCTPGPAAPPPVRTGPDGVFSFTRQPRGCWEVEVTREGAQPAKRSGGTGMEVDLLPIVPSEGLVRGPDGRPAAGAQVAWWWNLPEGEPLGRAVTDARGRFALTAPRGPLFIDAWTPTARGLGGGEGKIEVRLGEDTVPLLVRAPPEARVHVPRPLVFTHAMPDGTRVITGLPRGEHVISASLWIDGQEYAGPEVRASVPEADGVDLELPRFARLKVLLRGRTDDDSLQVTPGLCADTSDGCVLERATPGRYLVRAHRDRDHALGEVEVELRAGDDLVVPAPLDGAVGSVTGRLVDAVSGKPLAGMLLAASCWPGVTGHARFTTGPDGRFTLVGLLPAPDRGILVHPPEGSPYARARFEVEIQVGKTVDAGEVRVERR